jgi:hypothetical protein
MPKTRKDRAALFVIGTALTSLAVFALYFGFLEQLIYTHRAMSDGQEIVANVTEVGTISETTHSRRRGVQRVRRTKVPYSVIEFDGRVSRLPRYIETDTVTILLVENEWHAPLVGSRNQNLLVLYWSNFGGLAPIFWVAFATLVGTLGIAGLYSSVRWNQAPEPPVALCPYCSQELRTPASQQCRACGRDWHAMPTVRFRKHESTLDLLRSTRNKK